MFSVNYTKLHRNKAQILVFVLIWENKEMQNKCFTKSGHLFTRS
jgi:hypothetical protein